MEKLKVSQPVFSPPGELPAYSVRVSARAKNMHLKVSPIGRVEVVIPRARDESRVAAFVQDHAHWLRRTLAKVQAQLAHDPELQRPLPQRIHLRALERDLAVEYRERALARVRVQEGSEAGLLVQGPVGDVHACAASLRQWLTAHAQQELVPRVRQLSAELGLPCGRIQVRAQKTRWGSCSRRASICINRALLFLPPPLVRYLFVHELCHTVHMNHSARYWALVRRHEPACHELDRELSRAGRYVPLWAYAD